MDIESDSRNPVESRRDFVRKAAYAAPAILTLPAAAAYAKHGSEKADWQDDKDEGADRGNGQDKQGSDQGAGKDKDPRASR